MNKTSIEWTDYTWNPVTGCTKISAGCRSCYAETMATRFWGNRKFTDVQMHPERLNEPVEMGKKLHGKKVFVCDVSDLFHEKVTFEFIADVFGRINKCPDTIFQILTKRPDRALEFYNWAASNVKKAKLLLSLTPFVTDLIFPPKNIWIGTSVENQEQADIRIPLLLQIPASVRFLSCEPLIGELDLIRFFSRLRDGVPTSGNLKRDFFEGRLEISPNSIHWVIAGGESGHMARPMHPDWVRSLRDQCQSANVPFFFKQWGEWMPGSEYINIEGANDKPKNTHVWKGELNPKNLFSFKIGKSKTGNLLDRKQHLEFPKILNQ